MSTQGVTVEAVLAMLRKLSPRERVKAIVIALTEVENEMPEERKPREVSSLRGLWEGVSVSAEDINEVRREMLANFPRDDF